MQVLSNDDKEDKDKEEDDKEDDGKEDDDIKDDDIEDEKLVLMQVYCPMTIKKIKIKKMTI